MGMQKKGPICGKAADQGTSWFPFCNSRCRTRDSANWATGLYSIPDPLTKPPSI